MKKRIYKWLIRHYYFQHKAQYKVVAASRYYHKGGLFRLYGMYLYQRNLRRFPCDIFPHALIGDNFHMPHCLGIVIGPTASIGNNVRIYPNVVIGSKQSIHAEKPGDRMRRHAIIGDDCFLGSNAVILGDIVIGSNVTVAAGSVVDVDVPDNSLVYGHNTIRQKKIYQNKDI